MVVMQIIPWVNFNPRPREGSDLAVGKYKFKKIFISIHAPVKGATSCYGFDRFIFTISIHAPVKGATCC